MLAKPPFASGSATIGRPRTPPAGGHPSPPRNDASAPAAASPLVDCEGSRPSVTQAPAPPVGAAPPPGRAGDGGRLGSIRSHHSDPARSHHAAPSARARAASLSAVALKARLAAAAKLPPETRPRVLRIGVGRALHLFARPCLRADGGSWVLRYRVAGKAREMGLGAYPEVGLAEARRLAEEARALLRRGVDPVAARRAERARASGALSFEAAARDLIATRRGGWRSGKHAAQWMATLATHAFPLIGGKPVAEIETRDVLAVLRPVWERAPETASRLRQRIEAVLDHARVLGWRPETLANPARWKGHLESVLPSPRQIRPVRHHPALPWREMPRFMAALAERPGVSAAALRFVILTAARTGEVRRMTWQEVDFERRLWTVPAARMKAKRLHVVPLSAAALRVLEAMRPLARGPESLVFPSPQRGGEISDMSLTMLVRGMACDGVPEGEPPRFRDAEGRVPVPHGFRSAFKDWSRSQGWPDHLSEMALAHVDANATRAAYGRDALIEERRPMMEAWAQWCDSKAAAEIVPLRRKSR